MSTFAFDNDDNEQDDNNITNKCVYGVKSTFDRLAQWRHRPNPHLAREKEIINFRQA